MPRKKGGRDFLGAAEEAAQTSRKSEEETPPSDKPRKRKEGGGRPSTVDYERPARINVPVTQEVFDLLQKCVALETAKRYPAKVDKGVIVEEALTQYFKKHKIT